MIYYLAIGLSWLLFGIIHSITATNWFKRVVLMITGLSQARYRLLYNVMAVVSFVPVVVFLYSAPSEQLCRWNGSVWVGELLMGVGIIIGIVALQSYSLREFIGLAAECQAVQKRTLKQNGLLLYVRHPLYLGMLVVLLGLLVAQPDGKQLLFDLAAFLYIRIGIHYEERKLISVFGNQSGLSYKNGQVAVRPTFVVATLQNHDDRFLPDQNYHLFSTH